MGWRKKDKSSTEIQVLTKEFTSYKAFKKKKVTQLLKPIKVLYISDGCWTEFNIYYIVSILSC